MIALERGWCGQDRNILEGKDIVADGWHTVRTSQHVDRKFPEHWREQHQSKRERKERVRVTSYPGFHETDTRNCVCGYLRVCGLRVCMLCVCRREQERGALQNLASWGAPLPCFLCCLLTSTRQKSNNNWWLAFSPFSASMVRDPLERHSRTSWDWSLCSVHAVSQDKINSI